MRRCPVCKRTYADARLKFCRADGAALVGDSAATDSERTVDLSVWEASLETTPIVDTAPVLPRAPSTYAPSIAVLPFVNMTADQENDYFCDGLAEELLNVRARRAGETCGRDVRARRAGETPALPGPLTLLS